MLNADSKIYCAWPKDRCYKYVRVLCVEGTHYVVGHGLSCRHTPSGVFLGWSGTIRCDKVWAGIAAHGGGDPTLAAYTAAVDAIIKNYPPEGYLCHPGMSSLMPPKYRVLPSGAEGWYIAVPLAAGLVSRSGKPLIIKAEYASKRQTLEDAYLVLSDMQRSIYDQLGERLVKEGKAVSIDDSRIVWL